MPMNVPMYLDMIKFGMQSMLIQYHGRYYAYKGAAKGKMMTEKDITLRSLSCKQSTDEFTETMG
eukprot:10074671-Ditylum_brightwellii.AAC.1